MHESVHMYESVMKSCFRAAARDKGALHSLGITHIVNAAHGPLNPGPGHCFHVSTGPRFYRDMTVDYYGVEADDATDFILSPFFYPTARYIRAALAMGGKSAHVVLHLYMSPFLLSTAEPQSDALIACPKWKNCYC